MSHAPPRTPPAHPAPPVAFARTLSCLDARSMEAAKRRLRCDLAALAEDIAAPPEEGWLPDATFADVAVDAKSIAVAGESGCRPLRVVLARVVHDLAAVVARCDEVAEQGAAARRELADAAAARQLAAQQRVDAQLRELQDGLAEQLREREQQQRAQQQSIERDMRTMQGQIAACHAGLDEARAERGRAAESLLARLRAHDEEQRRRLDEAARDRQRIDTEQRRRLEEAEREREGLRAELRKRCEALRGKQRGLIVTRILNAAERRVRAVFFDRWLGKQLRKKRARHRRVLCARLQARRRHWACRWCYTQLEDYCRRQKKDRMLRKHVHAQQRHIRTLLNSVNRARRVYFLKLWQECWRERDMMRRERGAVQMQMVKTLQSLCREGMRRYWWAFWVRFLRWRRERNAMQHKAQVLAGFTKQGAKQMIFDRWREYLRRDQQARQRRGAADSLLSGTKHGVRHTYLRKLRAHSTRRAKLRRQRRQAEGFLSRTADKLRVRWFTRWRMWVRMRQTRVKLVGVMSGLAPQQIKKRYYHHWQEFLQQYKDGREERLRRALLNRRADSFARQVGNWQRRSHFDRWRTAAARAARVRWRQEFGVVVDQLRQRTDAMWTQLEFAQRTAGNTNSCVQRLVDRFIAVDASLDRLDKDKAARRELQVLVDTSAAASVLDPVRQLLAAGSPEPLDGDGSEAGAGGGRGSEPGKGLSNQFLGSLHNAGESRGVVIDGSTLGGKDSRRWSDVVPTQSGIGDGSAAGYGALGLGLGIGGRDVHPPPPPPPVRVGGGGVYTDAVTGAASRDVAPPRAPTPRGSRGPRPPSAAAARHAAADG